MHACMEAVAPRCTVRNRPRRKHTTLIKKLRKVKKEATAGEKPEPVRTHLRNMLIMPEMIGSIIGVYNGKTFNQASTPGVWRVGGKGGSPCAGRMHARAWAGRQRGARGQGGCMGEALRLLHAHWCPSPNSGTEEARRLARGASPPARAPLPGLAAVCTGCAMRTARQVPFRAAAWVCFLERRHLVADFTKKQTQAAARRGAVLWLRTTVCEHAASARQPGVVGSCDSRAMASAALPTART